MWEPYPDLDDEQALAFGQMTWSAVKLEGVVNRVCEAASSGSTETGSVSDHAKIARRAIGQLVQSEQVLAARKWLDRAVAVLDKRNTLVHVTTELWIDGDDMANGTMKLVNKRKKRETRTDLTASDFR